MEPYCYLLAQYLHESGYMDKYMDAAKQIEGKCYQILCKIQSILSDDQLDDPDCIMKIEEVLCTMESFGFHCGNRHDY